MDKITKKKLLIGAIILLLIINISALATIFYTQKVRLNKVDKLNYRNEQVQIRGMYRYLKDELKLSNDQFKQFKIINVSNKQKTQEIAIKLHNNRIIMVNEIAKLNPNLEKLDSIANEIGILHYQLKKNTISHFIELKAICNKDQQDKLQQLFIHIIQDQDNGRMRMRNQKEKHRRRQPTRHN